jgi:hypothetical protein
LHRQHGYRSPKKQGFDFSDVRHYSREELTALGDQLIASFPQNLLEQGRTLNWSGLQEEFGKATILLEADPCMFWIAFHGLERRKRSILDKEYFIGYKESSRDLRFPFSFYEFDLILSELRIYLFAVICCMEDYINAEKGDGSQNQNDKDCEKALPDNITNSNLDNPADKAEEIALLTGWPIEFLRDGGHVPCEQVIWEKFLTRLSPWEKRIAEKFHGDKLTPEQIAEDEAGGSAGVRKILSGLRRKSLNFFKK